MRGNKTQLDYQKPILIFRIFKFIAELITYNTVLLYSKGHGFRRIKHLKKQQFRLEKWEHWFPLYTTRSQNARWLRSHSSLLKEINFNLLAWGQAREDNNRGGWTSCVCRRILGIVRERKVEETVTSSQVFIGGGHRASYQQQQQSQHRL